MVIIQLQDTEEIFIDILKTYSNYTVADVKSQVLELPKPTIEMGDIDYKQRKTHQTKFGVSFS